jgi:crotonobetainyl-CoA:carnitine CoA-transferase CaiB-like acyl-CoA transferase
MAGALEGIRVVDLTAMFNGPLATMMLGDQGADVIKVEPPGTGDVIRQFGPQRRGVGAVFQAVNRNKRSVVIDLRRERGRELLLRLTNQADVFVQNFRPGVVERLGIGPEVLRERNPELIYASISAFGEDGPYAQRPGFDSMLQAVSGIASSQGDERPTLVRNAICDKVSGLQMAQAITAALFARERGSGGQHVRVSMLDASVAFLWADALQLHTYLEGESDGRERPVPRVLATLDGHVIVSSLTDPLFLAACRALGLPELGEDPRFSSVAARSAHLEELLQTFEERTKHLTTEEVSALFDEQDAAYAATTSVEDIARHPQVLMNGTLAEIVHPHCGRLRVPRPVERFESTPSTIRWLAPLLGEHSDEVLAEFGVADHDLGLLREEGVIG